MTIESRRPTSEADQEPTGLSRLRPIALPFAVGFAWLVGILHAVLGYFRHEMSYDLVVRNNVVEAFFQHGTIPAHAHVTAVGAYAPPGTEWLLMPGMLMFRDMRLAELVVAQILHALTLVGLAMLAKRTFGTKCAVLAVLLYGVSLPGLYFSRSLWPVGHAVFIVWMLYFALRWQQGGGNKFLGASLLTWLVGMWVYVAIAPAIVILPLAAIGSKTRFDKRSLAAVGAAVAISLVLWWPYLALESKSGFAGLRAQLFQQQVQLPPLKTVSSLGDPLVKGPPLPKHAWPELPRGFGFKKVRPLNLALLLLAFAPLPWLLRRPNWRLVGLSFAAITVILLLVVEPSKPYLFYQMAALQMLMLAALITVVLKGMAQKIAICLALIAVLYFVRLNVRRPPGQHPQQLVAQAVADLAKDGKIRAGFIVPFQEFELRFHAVDPGYKVGANLNFIMQRHDGVQNLTTSPEGYSAEDEYRVYMPMVPGHLRYEVPLDGWKLVKEAGGAKIYQRAAS